MAASSNRRLPSTGICAAQRRRTQASVKRKGRYSSRVLLVAAVYRPDQWRDFFVMVGGAAAVLTGLVFVALSLNLGIILGDAMHRSRSIGTLTNFTGIFVVCALALMGGQNHAAIGTEWLVVSISAAFVFVYPWPRARRESPSTLMLVRFITGISLYVAQIVGSAILLFGATAGLYIAAASMTFLAIYSISGAWLLLVSTYDDRRTEPSVDKDRRTADRHA
jgi:hypothetical protein